MVLYPLISKFNGGYTYLVGGLEHLDDFSIYWEWWSQLTFIFFRGVGQSPTRLHCRCKRPCSQGLLRMFPPAFCSLPLARSWRVHRRHHKEVPAARGWNVRFFREYDLQIYKHWWFQTCFIFHFIYGIILPIDELILFRGVGIPPTRYDLQMLLHIYINSSPDLETSGIFICWMIWRNWSLVFFKPFTRYFSDLCESSLAPAWYRRHGILVVLVNPQNGTECVTCWMAWKMAIIWVNLITTSLPPKPGNHGLF